MLDCLVSSVKASLEGVSKKVRPSYFFVLTNVEFDNIFLVHRPWIKNCLPTGRLRYNHCLHAILHLSCPTSPSSGVAGDPAEFASAFDHSREAAARA
jgi:hypothetical protein